MEEKFIKGLFLDVPHEKAPEWVKGKVSIKVPDFIAWLEKHQNNAGYVNIDLKESKAGKLYFQLNDWKPTRDKASEELNNQSTLNDF